MSIGTCATCAFFYEDDARTECRAKPPQLAFASGRGTVSHWPSVASSHWCGEYYDGRVEGKRKTYPQLVQDGDTTPHTWSLHLRQKEEDREK